MNPYQPKLDDKHWKSIALNSTTFVGLATAGFVVWSSVAPQASAVPLTATPPDQSTVQSLAGTWRVNIGGSILTMVVTPEGEVFLLVPIEQNTHRSVQTSLDDVAVTECKEVATTLRNSSSCEAVRLGVIFQKISTNAKLRPNTKVTDLDTFVQTQATLAKQSEGKQYIGALNRVQQAYYLEKARFTNKIEDLELGIAPETENYTYRAFFLNAPKTRRVESKKSRAVVNAGIARRNELKSYIGIVWLGVTAENEATTYSLICESDQPTTQLPKSPTFKGDGTGENDAICPPGFSPLREF